MSESTGDGISPSLIDWGDRLSRFAGLLTKDLKDFKRVLALDALRLPKEQDALPDSCADEPVAGGELLVRLHTQIDSWLRDEFTISRLVLGFFTLVGVILILLGIFFEQEPPLLSVTIGL